ncbi:MAG: hypothetical protein HUK25_10470 [Treponema sp.]|nr:hypothetical protein [Treponema sp.]
MADNEETEIISHLLEVEKEAYSIIASANNKYEKKIIEVKALAEENYKEQYQTKAAELEKEFELKKKQILDEHKKSIDDYKISVQDKPQHIDRFNDFLDQLIFKKA